jgi:type II secretory pathway pseudopilin PulG
MRGRWAAGFTMIELLLVVVIIMIATAIAVPSFIRSYRGAKLRTSARTITMVHRHARSMSVLGQQQIAVLFDAKKQELEVVSVSSAADMAGRSMFIDERSKRTTESVDAAPENNPDATEPEKQASVSSEMVRPLSEGVRIAQFESEKSGQEIDELYWINYYPNGMCDKFELMLTDAYGKSAEVKVDPLSGRVFIEYL